MRGILMRLAGVLLGLLLAGGDAYLIRNVRIFDGRSESVQSGEVLIVGNRIAAVSRLRITPPDGVKPIAIDGGGRLLMPGFIDAHVHMTSVMIPAAVQDNDPAYVAALEIKGARDALLRGFTTQRDTGGAVAGLKKAIDEGLVVRRPPDMRTIGITATCTRGGAEV
jgi:imidazolonepropionase-like amidohydrolase